jgi:NADH-quinone oxidoreductase subunit G
MCLVEVKGAPKPQASCAMGVRDLRPGPNGEPPEVRTNSPMVKKAREGVMEFLLINHPLDCPICDQGGECDLQDQAMAYGIDKNRFDENKRAVEDKYIGPLVKTIMTRCIHCTRCVRFTTEVAGCSELGADWPRRGHGDHHLSRKGDVLRDAGQRDRSVPGRRADLQALRLQGASVGADQDRNHRRDGRGRLGHPGRCARPRSDAVMPRLNEEVNEEWISDKTRFIWDGLRSQRLDKPYIRENGKLRAASWDEAFALIADKAEGLDRTRRRLPVTWQWCRRSVCAQEPDGET